MSNKMPHVLLTFLIFVLIIMQTCAAVSGEELPETTVSASSSPADSNGTEPASQTETGFATALTTEPKPTYSAALYPVLTVSAISNYFGRIDAEYNEFTHEVTVIYMLKASKRLLSVDWMLTYDTTLLKVDSKKNTKESICPVMSDGALLRIDARKGAIHYNATDLRLFDFSTTRTPFAKIVFDTAALTAEDSEIAKVDMSVNDLVVSEPDPKTAQAVAEKETVLVANSKVHKDSDTKALQVSKYTTITPSTFNEANVKPASRDQALTTVPVTTAAPTLLPSSAVTTAPAAPQNKPPEKEEPPVYTGTWYVAALILALLLACSTALLIMRKRDIYNS